ncbi:MAG: selenium-dependent xanthine dehydrogenase [Christensenellaceae bacterium]|jgi:selenium-dependent xanthine dehydrogenase|nr:selenium-dependent xanthine dehydrogenase [Christensenellaceae bacterium]
MATFTVNGQAVTVEKNQNLLRYLRDELRLTSVKDGCAEGACGTCTILIEGKATKCCVQQTDRMQGKTLCTVEGLSDFEKEVYTYAFGEAGAVQCGFCIPGMVLCAKALLAQNPAPTHEEIQHALRNNICRCTGYVKIIRAVQIATELFQRGEVPAAPDDWKVGARAHRIDVREKVLGYGEYTDDIYMEGMLHASAVRAAYPRARVLAIDTGAAKALPGVAGVFTAADIPGLVMVGHLKRDWFALVPVGEVTHYLGDAICLVAAETPEILAQAKALVRVEYEVLKPVQSTEESSAQDAPQLHPGGNLLAHKHVSRGDAEGAIAQSRHVLRGSFHTPHTEHAFLEPECAVAFPKGEGIMLYTSDQGTYDTQHETAPMLGLAKEQVMVENKLVGGGFGGKEDVTVQHHAALCALLTGRPVKCKLTRAESLLIHPKRHPMDMDFTLGCDENGIIQGVKATVTTDTGAYASLGGPVLERACTHAAGPYNYQNFEIDGYAWYTNNPPAGAYRGFGVTQTCFAIESLLNEAAEKIGISPWEIRYRNAIRPGQVLPNGQIVDSSTGLVETLEAVKGAYESARFAGIACAMKNAGVGVGIPDTGRVRLRIQNGQVEIHAGGSCIGQGLGTVLVQIVAEAAGLGREQIVYIPANTVTAPDSGTTSGSRHTLITGEATRRACLLFNDARHGRSLAEMDGEEYYGYYLAKTDALGSDKPNPVSHVAYGYATQVVILDDEGRLSRIVAAHDVGKAINPLSVEGQIEGGVVMSMGFALTEQYPLADCKPTAKYGTLGLFKANMIPKIDSLIVERPGLYLAYGAIGIGEITSIPTAPAIAEAYYRFDGKRRYALPLADTPYATKK